MSNTNDTDTYLADVVRNQHPLAKHIINSINKNGRLMHKSHPNKITIDEIQYYEQLAIAESYYNLEKWYNIMPNHQRKLWRKFVDAVRVMNTRNDFKETISNTLDDQWSHQHRISLNAYVKYVDAINSAKAPNQNDFYNWLQLIETNLVATLSSYQKSK